jgi:hypothetical protein
VSLRRPFFPDRLNVGRHAFHAIAHRTHFVDESSRDLLANGEKSEVQLTSSLAQLGLNFSALRVKNGG